MCKFKPTCDEILREETHFFNVFMFPSMYFNSKSASNQKKKKHATILVPMIKAFGVSFLFGTILELVGLLLEFASPQLLREIVKFVDSSASVNATQSNDKNHPDIVYSPMWHGIFYAVLLFIVASIKTLCSAQYNKYMEFIGLRVRTALVGIIYQKSLCLSNTARKSKTTGEIVNLMAVDTMRLKDLTTYINMVWSSPLQIVLAIYFLWDLLGVSVLAGNHLSFLSTLKKLSSSTVIQNFYSIFSIVLQVWLS